jgi:uncharacterized protein YkwD
VAALGYHPVGEFLNSSLGVVRSLANVLAYLLILIVAQFGLLLLVRQGHRVLPTQAVLSWPNQAGGVVLAVVQMVLLAAVGMAVFANLPLSSESKTRAMNAPLAQPLIRLGNSLQNVINSAPGDDLSETLNLLTVDPESDRLVMLGFRTASVTVNETEEQHLLSLFNQEREPRGLEPLSFNPKAAVVARQHCIDMFTQGYFSHKSLDGRTPFERMKAGGVSYHTAGENLALAPTIELAHSGLMNSPGHRANILSTNYKQVGIGVVVSPRYGLMVAQEFTD